MNTTKNKWKVVIKIALLLLLIAAIGFVFAVAVKNIRKGADTEGISQLEEAIRRAAISCYATEGFYPPDLLYITEHYGIQIDTDLYNVFYEPVGDNLMPSITVLKKSV